MKPRDAFLISEFCSNAIYEGWHLYLRDSNGRQQRNANGDWGWLRRSWGESQAHAILATLGIQVTGDGTCDGDGYDEMSRRFPIPRQRIGGKPRGCIPVHIDEHGKMTIRSAEAVPA